MWALFASRELCGVWMVCSCLLRRCVRRDKVAVTNKTKPRPVKGRGKISAVPPFSSPQVSGDLITASDYLSAQMPGPITVPFRQGLPPPANWGARVAAPGSIRPLRLAPVSTVAGSTHCRFRLSGPRWGCTSPILSHILFDGQYKHRYHWSQG